MGWVVNATLQPFYPRRKTRYPLYRRLGGAPVPVWTGAENIAPTGSSLPGVKRPGAWRWPPISFSAIKLYFYLPSGPSWQVIEWILTFTLHDMNHEYSKLLGSSVTLTGKELHRFLSTVVPASSGQSSSSTLLTTAWPWRHQGPSKRPLLFTTPHNATSRKPRTTSSTAVKTPTSITSVVTAEKRVDGLTRRAVHICFQWYTKHK